MSIRAPKTDSKAFELVPAGNHVARCYRVIHIGTALETYMGEKRKMNKVIIGFELPNETKEFNPGEGQKPFVIFREYTLSMYEKAKLFQLVTGMLGRKMSEEEAEDFDVKSLVGQTCLLNVIHRVGKESGKERAEIESAAPMPNGMSAPDAVNATQVLDYEEWDEQMYESLPDFMKQKIQVSEEYDKMRNPEAVSDEIDPDQIPF